MTATFTRVPRIVAALAMLAGLLAGIRPAVTTDTATTYYDIKPPLTTVYLADGTVASTYYDI